MGRRLRQLEKVNYLSASVLTLAQGSPARVTTAATAAMGTGSPPRGDEVVGQQQDRRPDDGGQPGVEVEEPVQGVDVEQLRGQPAAKQRSDHPDHAGQDQALLSPARD